MTGSALRQEIDIKDSLKFQAPPRSEPRAEVRVDRIQGRSGFRDLRQSWDSLLDESAADNMFLTWEWLYSWFEHLRRDEELAIFRLSCGSETIGLLPLLLRSRLADRALGVRSADFLGMRAAGSDYLDAIIRRGWEERALKALDGITENRRLVIRVGRAKADDSFIARWSTRLQQRGWRVSTSAAGVCPHIPLAGHTWESYLQSTGKQHRYTVQRKLRNIAKTFEVRFERATSEMERRRALSLLIAMHNLRWDERGGSSAFCTPALAAFHDEFTRLALARGWLRLFTLRLNGRPAAALYGLCYKRVFYFYQSGLDPAYAKHSVGLVLMAMSIQSAIGEGCQEYDFLHGDEAYKFHWAPSVRRISHFLISPPGAAGEIYQQANVFSHRARLFARRRLPKSWADSIAAGLRRFNG